MLSELLVVLINCAHESHFHCLKVYALFEKIPNVGICCQMQHHPLFHLDISLHVVCRVVMFNIPWKPIFGDFVDMSAQQVLLESVFDHIELAKLRVHDEQRHAKPILNKLELDLR